MQSKTAIAGKNIIYSYPIIFRSYKSDSFSFSHSEATDVPEKGIQISYQADRKPAGYSFASYTILPELKQNPQHAVYDFCVSISTIHEVKAVTYQTENSNVLVWSFISKRDKQVRRLIYEKEMKLMGNYPDMVFDFNVVTISRYSETFIPQDLQGYLVYYRDY
jgi:hypothetical protein